MNIILCEECGCECDRDQIDYEGDKKRFPLDELRPAGEPGTVVLCSVCFERFVQWARTAHPTEFIENPED